MGRTEPAPVHGPTGTTVTPLRMREGDAEADSGLGQNVPTTWPARLPAVGGFARRKGRRRSPNGRFE